MLEISELLENSGGAGGTASTTAAVNLKNEEGCFGGGASPSSGGFGEEERVRGDRNFAGNRWPREETLALLKIRSEMDVAFRDSTLKAPLWDEVSRKLAELGYHRGAKKCKEKLENMCKYHKRTKEGRQNGKNYRFLEQLELFDNHQSSENKIQASVTETTMAMAMTTSEFNLQNTTSSLEHSDKKRRKLGDCFETLMKKVLEKQENLQNKFMEAMEKCEKDRIAREEAWKMQELARMKREQEMLAHERAVAAAKDAAVIAFLQKISEQASPTPPPEKIIESDIGENSNQASSSRWPKAEVEALIRLRTNLDLQYQLQDKGPPLWEEISSAMKKLGYDRSAKRCKEKWENINKYFKRVRESDKKRPQDSKTCSYFHMLESLYQHKSKKPEEDMCQQEQEQQRPESVIEDGETDDDYQIVATNPSSVTPME
uniref:Putative trihelix transcription factor GT-2 n=1 Tax=Davidia involucrata TaxID=16924 RepID=A0A5B7A9I3_DAVIN